ncbi:hypothetical protein BC629DRAFT_728052 [Irpex lacteus]|nr:hypothetical protein BC629DRAFT_728052 [Irpex lacteus]
MIRYRLLTRSSLTPPQVVDPVDRLLAYIIEHSSCDVAVACYEDLQVAEEAILMDRAEDIDEYLRRLRPQIDVSSEGVGTVARTTEMPNLPHEQVLSIPFKPFPAPSPSLFNMPTLSTSGWMFLSVRLPQWHLLVLPEGKTRADVERALQTCNQTDTVAIGRLLLTV